MRKIVLLFMVMTAIMTSYCGCGATDETVKPQDTDESVIASTIESTQECTSVGITEDDNKQIEQLLDSWDFMEGDISLTEVVDNLNEYQITYTGLYNLSKERLNLTLSNGSKLVFFSTTDSDMNSMGYYLVMKNQDFDADCFQEDYLNNYDVTTDEYYFPELADKLLVEDDLWRMNQTDLSILRNQIYARHGRVFKDDFLSAVFSQKSWYDPVGEGEDFDNNLQREFTDIEKQNLQLLKDFEYTRGYLTSGDFSIPSAVLNGSLVDLDGDGNCEQLTYTLYEEEDSYINNMTLQVVDGVSKEIVTVEEEECSLHENCYIASMDQKEWFIIVGSNGASADYSMSFYRYQDGKLIKLGNINSDIGNLRLYPEKMTAYEETYHLQCQPLQFDFIIQDGEIVRLDQDYYEYYGNVAEANMEVPLYTEKDGKEIGLTLQQGDEIIVTGGDLKEWVLLEKKSTGEKGWLKVIGGQCYLPDGTVIESSLCFEGLYFYG